jgi:UDP-N-acetylmuramoylalanine--D-glutamate ligase
MGAGKSGIAAAQFLVEHGAKVWLNDEQSLNLLNTEALNSLASQGVHLELGMTGQALEHGVDLILQSPGVPLDNPTLSKAAAAGIPIISEIELGYLATKAPIVGITGSNGKTTTTRLIGNIMSKAYPEIFVGGNIGTPFILEAEKLTEAAWAVLELSSFQLETIRSFRPKIGVILNFSPDHLDRHKTYENYCAAKWRIAEFQKPTDYLVLNFDDPLIKEADLSGIKSQIIYISRKTQLNQGVWVNAAGEIRVSWQGREEAIMHISEIQIPGNHNLENVLAAVGTTFAAGVPSNFIAEGVREFQGVAHRIESVLEHQGVLYVNDSKGTNTDAAIKAIDAFQRPVILIAGGLGKGGSYQELAEKIKEKVKLLVLIGTDGDKIEETVRQTGFKQIYRAIDLADAVTVSAQKASEGDVVLLSPACASYDMFANYAERGNMFKSLVKVTVAAKGE